MKNYKIFVLIILILVFISVFFVFKYRSAMKELRLIKENSVNQELNVKTIDFTNFFIKNFQRRKRLALKLVLNWKIWCAI